MSVRIVDYKKLEMTEDEWQMYQNICRSYDRPNFKGEDLFRDLFETDEDGIIVFLKPPTKSFTSMEVFLFLVALFNHQHMRQMHEQTDAICARLEALEKRLNK